MMKVFEPYILAFIPIFVAVDAIGNIPLFISLVTGSGKKQRDAVILESVTVATVIAILFLLIGKWVLGFLGITISDFQIAGGILLFVIAVRLLLPGAVKHILSDGHDKDIGVFPLGTPLITGPAVLTTTLMMLDTFGISATFVSLAVNMFIVWLTLINADAIIKIMGQGGIRAVSKLMYILLAAIGVMMVRKGIVGAFLR
ncbi:MAG: MarC family protein [Candidatus Omnitrophota bacterium]